MHYTANSTYHANLEVISSTLPINASSTPSLFAKISVGHALGDTAYGLALCRGDANASVCNACLTAAFQDAQNVCKLQKDTTVYYESCLLRFSDDDFLRPSNGTGDGSFQFIMWNTEDITEPLLPGWDPSNQDRIVAITGVITRLLNQTADQAAHNSSRRYATSMVEVSSTLMTIYSLAQCTPDLTPTECWECLQYISQQMMSEFGGQKGGRYVIVRCNIRYEVYQFYQGESKEHIASPPIAVPPTTPAVPPTPTTVPSLKQHNNFGLAKIFSKNDIEGSTQRIAGTYGYIAPEYASKGLFSIKSDVFSFGVLTLEIINGNRASSSHGYGDFINLLGYAWQLWKDGLWLQLLDATLATDPHTLEMMRYINIALLCVQENAADRPTMSDVVAMLNSESMTLPEPKHPAYFHIRVTQDDASMVDESSVVTESAQHSR
ncbi:unnamed protein product [Urochloa decumbens]|uniref:Cysteine-rich receptor-like protein kinase 10 n=1 Tax=Urochloa decumbens TaxID=240449 RepID=A0ABC9HHP6_9POAL